MDDLVLLDTKNQTWKDDKSRFGFKMLQKMGWREDKGLGKNDSGSVASIKVSKREEGLGLGMEKVTDSAGALGWNSTANSFNEVLKRLNESYSKPKTSKKSKIPILTAGMKYKKHSAAKDLSTKSAAELKSIFGQSVNAAPSQETSGESSSSKSTSKKMKASRRDTSDDDSVSSSPEEEKKRRKKKKTKTVEEDVDEEEAVTEQSEKKKKKKKRDRDSS